MTATPGFPGGVWAVDFEFHPARGQEGDPPLPVCMVARELRSGRTLRSWHDDLMRMPGPPFPTDRNALFVAYFASAEMGCFLALGWPIPANILDLFTEFRCLTNGTTTVSGNGLLGALTHFGLPAIEATEKEEMRELILSRGPWSEAQRDAILDYCESDVRALAHLYPAMCSGIDWQRALLRGQYMAAVADMEFRGIPIDVATLARLSDAWEGAKDQLIAEVDRSYGVYDERTFVAKRFEHYLETARIPWPRLPSGVLDLKDETFRDMARSYPQLAQLRELRSSLGQMRLSSVSVGADGRNRCLLSPFKSVTGRNQPSNSRFIFGPSAWLRGLIRPSPGWAIAYVDWSQQEFGIAAALSGDKAMMVAYASGDPYLAFAKQAGAVPDHATKASHKAEREQFKACVLAVQYGMGAESLALRINQPVARARQLLDLHRRTYKQFWAFSDAALNEAALGGALWTPFGWRRHTAPDANERSLRNWPMQATGADMLRIACVLLRQAGVRICAPVHDAILIEAPIDEVESEVERTKGILREASRIVLDGFELSSDPKIVKYPDRYMDDRGVEMWERVMRIIDRLP